MTFDLSDFVSEIMKREDIDDPQELATIVSNELIEDVYLDAIEQTLPEYCRHILKNGGNYLSVPDEPTSDISVETDDEPEIRPGPSRLRMAGERRIRRLLERREAVPGFKWYKQGDLTAIHITALVDDRKRRARELDNIATVWEELRSKLYEYEVSQVKELPESVLLKLLPKL